MSPPGRIISVVPARRNDGRTRSSAAAVERSSTTRSSLLCRAAYVALIMMGLALAGCETSRWQHRHGAHGHVTRRRRDDRKHAVGRPCASDGLGWPVRQPERGGACTVQCRTGGVQRGRRNRRRPRPRVQRGRMLRVSRGPRGRHERTRRDPLRQVGQRQVRRAGVYLGGSLLQDHAIGRVKGFTFVPEVVPRRANQTALRITTPLVRTSVSSTRCRTRRSCSSRGTRLATRPRRVARRTWSRRSRPDRSAWAGSDGRRRFPPCISSPAMPISTRWGSRTPSSRSRTRRRRAQVCPAVQSGADAQ